MAWFPSSDRPSASLFLVYAIKSTFFLWFSFGSSIASTLLILKKKKKKKNRRIPKGKVAILSCKFSCLRDTVCICGKIFVKLAQFTYIINVLNPIDLTISKEKVAISRYIFLNYLFQTTETNSIGSWDLKCIHFRRYWIYKNWWWMLWKLHLYLLNEYNLLKISLLWLNTQFEVLILWNGIQIIMFYMSMGECNTILSAYTLCRHLG